MHKRGCLKREDNLPGTGDTVITQAVPSGGDRGIALRSVEACDLPKRGRLGCIIFDRGGLRSRIPRTCYLNKTEMCSSNGRQNYSQPTSHIYVKMSVRETGTQTVQARRRSTGGLSPSYARAYGPFSLCVFHATDHISYTLVTSEV